MRTSSRRLYTFRVDHPSLEPFAPTLRSIVQMAFTSGLNALASMGRTMQAIKTDASARARFLRGCHRGYDKAQQRIGSLVIQFQQEIATSETVLSQLKQDRDRGRHDAQLRLLVVRNRQLALRRMADALLHTITGLETWMLRRLVIEDRIRDIDPLVLKKTLAVAARRNAESRLRFAVVGDLTTVVQLGDLVEVSFGRRDPRWQVIELKEGRVNELLSGLLEADDSDENARELDSKIANTLGKHAATQAGRIRRQRRRLAELERIITTDKGMDPALDVPLMLTPERVFSENYLEAIHRVVEGTRAKGVASASLAGGLHIIGMKRDHVHDDYIGAVAHLLLHLRHPERQCGLMAGRDEGLAEFREIQEVPVFVDLVAHNMHAQWGLPVFLWMAPEKTVDLVMGDIRIFAQFDMEAFFSFAGQHGIQLTWVTGKSAEPLKKEKLSYRIPGSPNAWGIRAIMPDGTQQTLFSGFVARVIADLTTPRQLLELIVHGPEQARRMGVVLE